MSATIQPRDLDLSIFGTAQVDYTVDGVTGCTYDKAVAMAGLQRAVAVESAIPAYTAAVRARQRKLEDLGRALADISGTLAKFDEDHRQTTSEQDIVGGAETYNLLAKYGLTKDYFKPSATRIQYQYIQKLQTDVQYALDVTNNDIQQDAVSLQGFVSKRDSAYQMAVKLLNKASQTRATGIRYIG